MAKRIRNSKVTTQHRIPKTLSEFVRDGRCVAWVGAGLSAACDLPLWKDTVDEFVKACSDQGLTLAEVKELNELQKKSELEDVAAFCKSELGENEYGRVLMRLFRHEEKSSALHEQLASLPFAAILTTNYDCLIEDSTFRTRGRSPVYTHQDGAALWQQLAQDEHFILKLHGDIQRPRSVIFTGDEYTRHVFGNLALMEFLRRLFSVRSVLFLGTSLTDTYVRMMLEEIAWLTKNSGPPHYALVPGIGRIQSKLWRDRYNVTPLSYDCSDKSSHEATVSQFLTALAKRSREKS